VLPGELDVQIIDNNAPTPEATAPP
jgi:hypothetical protein